MYWMDLTNRELNGGMGPPPGSQSRQNISIKKDKKWMQLIIVPDVNTYTYFITTEDTESTEGLCPYFIYSVFSVLSVVKL
jgi:hypothetical protein